MTLKRKVAIRRHPKFITSKVGNFAKIFSAFRNNKIVCYFTNWKKKCIYPSYFSTFSKEEVDCPCPTSFLVFCFCINPSTCLRSLASSIRLTSSSFRFLRILVDLGGFYFAVLQTCFSFFWHLLLRHCHHSVRRHAVPQVRDRSDYVM